MSQQAFFYAIGWLVSAFLIFGVNRAYGRKNFASIHRELYWEDAGMAVLYGSAWPISLPIIFLMTGFAHNGFEVRKEK